MSDGTQVAEQTPKSRFGDTRERVQVQFTNEFDKYLTAGGQQFNAGERAALLVDDADAAIRASAAVRVQGSGADAETNKALLRSPHNKMVETAKNK